MHGSSAALLNGVLIGKAGLSFFVVTLASLSLLRGAVFVYTEGKTERVPDDVVAKVGDGKIAGLSVPVLLMLAVFIISLLVLHYTRFGRAVYAVGGNKEAARLSGINVAMVIIAVYAISGFFAGLAGVIQTGRLGAAAPVAGTGIELSAAAAVLLGRHELQRRERRRRRDRRRCRVHRRPPQRPRPHGRLRVLAGRRHRRHPHRRDLDRPHLPIARELTPVRP